MIDYRYHLTALVAVFLALGLGMLIGITLIGSPSPESQMRELLSLQQNFEDIRKQHDALRDETDDLKTRLKRSDAVFRDILPVYAGRRLSGDSVAIILTGEIEDTAFLPALVDTLKQAGADIVNTTRLSDDWLPTDPADRGRVLNALGVVDQDARDAEVAAAVGRAIGNGRAVALLSAARAASGLRLEGDYARSADGVLLITGTRTEERRMAARVALTPEAGLLAGLGETPARIVLTETAGPETLTTIPYWMRDVKATVDNIDMASGQYSAVWTLAGRNGRFGLKNAAERPIPKLGLL